MFHRFHTLIGLGKTFEQRQEKRWKTQIQISQTSYFYFERFQSIFYPCNIQLIWSEKTSTELWSQYLMRLWKQILTSESVLKKRQIKFTKDLCNTLSCCCYRITYTPLFLYSNFTKIAFTNLFLKTCRAWLNFSCPEFVFAKFWEVFKKLFGSQF